MALITLPSILPFTSFAAGSTVPVFLIDANNPSSFTFTGTTVNSSVTESANSISGTASGLTYDSSTPTKSLVFGTGRYITFTNNVKPDITNGVSIQMVAYFTSSSYNGTWPRLIDLGPTSGWGSGNDYFSVQLSDSGQLQVYMSRSGTTGGYFCGTSASAVVPNAFAMYSIQVGPGGVCTMAVNGTTAASTNTEATTSYAGKVPNISSTLNFRIGSMNTAVQSTLPDGKIRTVIMSSGTTSTNAVTFIENGGTGFMASQLGTSSAALSANQFTRAGFSFTGWNTKADGTGTPYANGASYNFAAASVMLYAQWSVVPPTLTIPTISTTTYRTLTPVTMTINTAGRYTFYESGKRIARCTSIVGTPPTVSCNWLPSKIGSLTLSALGKISSIDYPSNQIKVNVTKRSSTR